MSEERRDRIRGLFDALEELRQDLGVDARRQWLQERCEGDQELYDEVWGLHEKAGEPDTEFLKPPVVLTRPEDLIGMELQGYRLHSILGVGGMGAVYRAHSKHGKQEVALKVLHPSFFGEFEIRRRFDLEVELSGKLKHPNIVRLLTAGEERGLLWFAMDLVDGWSLGELQKMQRAGEELPPNAPDISDPAVIAGIVRELAEALSCAHSEGVLHRDVKPGNLLIDHEGRVHLADFGLARVLDADPVTISGMVGGTCSYMSPEQARQLKDAVKTYSDIYSMGAVFYELLAGEPPFGLDGSPAVLRHIAEEEVPALRKGRGGVDPGLAVCALKALRLAPEERYASAKELSDDLARWLAGKPVLARAPSVAARLKARFRSRKFVALSASVAVLLTVVISAVAMWWNGQRTVRASWAQILVDSSNLPVDTKVHASIHGVGTEALLLEEGPITLGGKEWTLAGPSGIARIRVQSPGRPVQEYVRLMHALGDVALTPKPAHPLPESVSFIAVAPGRLQLETRRSEQPPMLLDVQVAAFQISQFPISNKEFEQYLQESGRSRSDKIRQARARLMPSSGVAGWLDMPATDIPYGLAQEAAEWWGCRLPTRAEWEWAVSQHVSLESNGSQLVFSEAPWFLDEDKSRSTFLAYLKFARMGKARELAGADEMVLANVSEWTTTPKLHESQGVFSMVPDMVHLCGVNWHAQATQIDLPRLREARNTFITMPSGDVGFRLVRNN